AASSLRLVITNLMRSPTRARSVGPGTWSPKVQALNFTPGAISMILWVVSRRTVLTDEGSRGFSFSPMLSEAPSAKAPLWRSPLTLAGGDSRTICGGWAAAITAARPIVTASAAGIQCDVFIWLLRFVRQFSRGLEHPA